MSTPTPDPDGPLADAADFAREVSKETTTGDRLQRAVELVVELVDGCHHAGITVAAEGRLDTPAASDELVRTGDRWQYEFGEGPCLDSVRLEHTVISQDLARERRWPRWAPRVRSELGVSSMMSLLVFTHSDTYGALNLYGDHPRQWDADDLGLAYALAGHLGAAVQDSLQIADLGRAMINRTVIGQAEGIVMERFGVSADQAFAVLRRISQDTNRKVVAVAEEVVATRRLPEAPTVGSGRPSHGPG